MPPGFDRLESFGHDELTAKHCYFRCSRPPDVDGIKIFDKDDQATKHCFYQFFSINSYQVMIKQNKKSVIFCAQMVDFCRPDHICIYVVD